MILKVVGNPGNEYVLGDVEEYFRVSGTEDMGEFNSWIDPRTVVQDTDGILHARLRSGDEKHILANAGTVFVMNDNGKTIEHF